MSIPLYKSAFQLGKEISLGQRSSVETLEFFIDRLSQHNEDLNAVVAFDLDGARKKAMDADKAASSGKSWGPLHGVPVTLKDAFSTKGLVTTGGIPNLKAHVPEESADAVQCYEKAGAIIFGKTNVPYFCGDLQSYNEIYGTTKNPWRLDRTCGGSSGGAAAALAAGITPLELGSDIGGSIRVPCHFNGIYGHKPSFGLVSYRGHVPPSPGVLTEPDLSVIGPMSTSARDLEQAFDLLISPNKQRNGDWSIQLQEPEFSSLKELRVAVWSNDDFCPVDNEISEAILKVGEYLQSAGATVNFKARPSFDPEINHINFTLLMLAQQAAGMPEGLRKKARKMVESAEKDDMHEPLLQMRGISIDYVEWMRQNEIRLQTKRSWSHFFAGFDVLLCPCTSVTAFPHDHEPDIHKRRITVNQETRRYSELMRWPGLTINAHLPSTVVPIAKSSDGMPIGMQITSNFLSDRTTLSVAQLLESSYYRFVAPDGYTE